jgi:hypothetical protein
MQPFQQDFQDRKRHVRHYLAVVTAAERNFDENKGPALEGRLLVLRAGTFLVLYNLIEATTRAAVDAIHDTITTGAVSFSDLILSLRREAIRLFKRGANPGTDHTLDDFPAAFVAIALEQRISLSGSVDARAIRELGLRYGFSCDTNKSVTRDGSDLLRIKTNRNDLAHGVKTFEEVGRDTTALELLLLARRSMLYMGGVLRNVGRYLDNEEYLEKAET